MDILAILGIVAWVILSAVSKKKKQEAKAARENAAQEDAAPSRPAPAQPSRPVQKKTQEQTPFDPYFSAKTADAPSPSAPVPAQHKPIQATMQRPLTSQLTEIAEHASSHVVEASSISGHAHEETSMSGIAADCKPEPHKKRSAPATVPAPAAASASAFSWDPADARNGLILAEIMGKPKALRRS